MKKVLSLALVLLVAIPIPIQAQNKVTSMETYNQGLAVSGKCLAKEVTLSEELKGMMIATAEGLQFIENNQFIIKINHPVNSFEVVDDLDGDGVNDVAVYLDVSRGYSNFQIISSKNSKILYEKALTYQTVDENENLVTKNSIVRKIFSSEKIVYLVYDYHLLAIDVNKNEIIFDHKDNDNIWNSVVIGEQIIFTTQTGELVSINKIKGKENYRQKLTTPIAVSMKYRRNEKQEVEMNLWDILVHDDKLYVSSEMDKIYQVDINNGEIIKELDLKIISEDKINKRLSQQTGYSIGEQKDIVYATGVFSKAFNSYKMKMLNDDLMLVEAYLGDPNYYKIEELSTEDINIEPTLLIIDTNNLEIKTTIQLDQYNLDSSNALYTIYQGQEVIVIPSNINKGALRVSIYSFNDGKLIAQNDIKNLGLDLENTKISIAKYQKGYLLQVNASSTYYLADDLKTINSLGSSKIVNRIAYLQDGLLVSNNQNGKIDEICKLGLNGKDDILMKIDAPKDYLNNGFEVINYDENSNCILSLVNEVNNQNAVVASHIVVISVNDGKIIVDKKVLLKDITENSKYLIGEEIKYFSDLNNDGKKEILVDNVIVDGNSFAMQSYYEQIVEDNGTIIEAGDLNNDGICDLISVSETEMRIYHSNKNGFEITYQKSDIVKKYDKSLLNNQHVKVIGDLEHNGINLFVINARNNNGCQYYQVINPKDLSVRFNLMEEGVYNYGESFALINIDFNQDGCDDILFNLQNSNQKVLSGKDGTIITEIQKSDEVFEQQTSPVALEDIIAIDLDGQGDELYQLEDITGDGTKELGYIYFNYNDNDNYVKLRILDGKSLEELKICNMDNLKFSDFMLVPIQGQNKIMIKGEYNQIYDYNEEKLVAGCDIEAVRAQKLSDGRILIENALGWLYAFNDQCDFELIDFNQDKLSSGNINVKYESEKKGLMSVYDRGTLIAVSTEKEINLKLLEGKHKLVFSYNDGQGKITNITKQIEISKSSIIKYLVILVSLLIVIASCLIIVYPKYRLEKKAGVKHAKSN